MLILEKSIKKIKKIFCAKIQNRRCNWWKI